MVGAGVVVVGAGELSSAVPPSHTRLSSLHEFLPHLNSKYQRSLPEQSNPVTWL